jgi:hypothetical protein
LKSTGEMEKESYVADKIIIGFVVFFSSLASGLLGKTYYLLFKL